MEIVLRARTACHFSSLIWLDGPAPATVASLLSNFRSHKSLEQHSVSRCFATFLPFRAPGSSFSSGSLFVDLLSSSLHFSYSSHLCFSSFFICPDCCKFDFKAFSDENTSNYIKLWFGKWFGMVWTPVTFCHHAWLSLTHFDTCPCRSPKEDPL